jgi:hypothetical protein
MMLKLIKEDRSGIVLVATPRAMGLTTAMYAIIRRTTRSRAPAHRRARPDVDLEGITQNKLAANAPAAEEAKTIGWAISQEPDSIMIPRLEDSRSRRNE